ncbi:MAG: sulfite exporter TauE/SafE family protein [Anaerolineae bacterium]|nr:sulfite exporter TauE/SafE family protein [Anaerolineae bacterium]NUQ05992.1 sulfite exporter TauE/SafE family protein [Anaerolineae bacterium]
MGHPPLGAKRGILALILFVLRESTIMFILPPQAVGLLVLGLVAGVLSGMFGIGGGVVIVPILTTFFGFALQSAIGTSLGALLMPVAILAVIEYYRAGKLKIAVAAPVAAGLVVGGWIGAQIAFGLPVNTLRVLYGFFLLFASWRFAEPRKWIAELRGGRLPAAPAEPSRGVSLWVLLALGFGAGIISGLFGVGGGIVIVPALVGLLRFDQKEAVATSLGALLLPVGLPAVITYYNNNAFDIATAVVVAVGLVFGAFGGARITLSLPSTTVKRLYGVFLLLVGLRFIFGG